MPFQKGLVINLDTTERITILCDGDKSLKSSIVAEVKKWVTVGQLQLEYQFLELAKKTAMHWREIGVSISESISEIHWLLSKVFNEVHASNKYMESLAEYFESIMYLPKNDTGELPKLRGNNRSNDYPREHYLPVMRRMRCRWRQRESNKQTESQTVCIDIDEDLLCA